jgi:hypothetical protein
LRHTSDGVEFFHKLKLARHQQDELANWYKFILETKSEWGHFQIIHFFVNHELRNKYLPGFGMYLCSEVLDVFVG